MWWKSYILGSHYSICCVYENTCYISLFEFHSILYALKFKFCILWNTEWHTTLPWSWCENTVTLVGPQRYWMWQRAHCVSSSCPELCIRERELEAQGYCIEVVTKRNNDSVSLTSPNRRHVPRLWMTSSARSEWSESHTRPMLMISGQFIRNPPNPQHLATVTLKRWEKKEGILSTCACEREKRWRRDERNVSNRATRSSRALCSAPNVLASLSHRPPSSALAAVYGNRLWRRAPLPAWPLPSTYKNLAGTAFVERAAGWQTGWHQTWAGRD